MNCPECESTIIDDADCERCDGSGEGMDGECFDCGGTGLNEGTYQCNVCLTVFDG